MLPSISLTSSSSPPTTSNVDSHPVQSQGNSTDGTPQSSTHPSPAINLTPEYIQAVQNEMSSRIDAFFNRRYQDGSLEPEPETSSRPSTMNHFLQWSKIHVVDPCEDVDDHVQNEEGQEQLMLEQVLQPSRQFVEEALIYSKTNQLTRLVHSYFDINENTSHLCILIHQSLIRARDLYAPLYRLFDVLPEDGKFSQSQCDRATNLFLDYDCLDNPFPCPDSNNFKEMRRSFSHLKLLLDSMLSKSRTRARLFRNATMVSRLKQLDAAARGTYVINNDLDNIDRLVARLYTAVEGDKLLIRIGIERSKDKQATLEVLTLMRQNHVNFLDQLKDLEEHICLCIAAVNRARSLLLNEISIHQSSNS